MEIISIKYILIALIGGLASFLSNKSVAVYHDGLRPIVPGVLDGSMTRKDLAATSFAMSLGLVVGFGIPFSLTTSIILIHSILLTTDIIGTSCPDTKKGTIVAVVLGAIYSILLLVGLRFVVDAFAMLPVNILAPLGKVGSPIISAFAAFPALVVAYQYGAKKGLFAFLSTVILRQVTLYYGVISLGTATIKLNADGMALLVGMIIMLFFAMREKNVDGSNSNEMLLHIFGDRIKRIKKNIVYLAIMGGLISAGSAMQIIASDPISINLLSTGKVSEAALTTFTRSIGFIPLIATTAIATGVYSPAGLYFVFAVGLFIGNPVIAFLVGALVIVLEILMLESIAKMLDKFPGIKNCGDQIRTSMTKILEISLLVGGMIAADAMISGLGYLFVGGFYLMNKTFKKPMVDMAVGPVAAILFGVLVNVFALVGLYVPVIAK